MSVGNGQFAEDFTRVVDTLARQEGTPRANVTFFLGAGFPKAWDPRFPTSSDLYTLTRLELLSEPKAVDHFLASLGDLSFQDITSARFKDIVYQLNMQIRYPGIRTRYLDESGIRLILDELTALIQERFDSILPINFFDEERQAFPLPVTPTPAQEAILAFFADLQGHPDPLPGHPEGVRLNFITTNYDFLIETILDNICGPEESVFSRVYRGITPSCISGCRNPRLVHDPHRSSILIKLNGGFEILRDNGQNGGYRFDYRKRPPHEVRQAPPIIMLPSREQDYTHHYFAAVFPKAVRLLQESRVLVIVGYSLPEEDALLRFLLRQFAEDPGDAASKYIFYVDLMPAEEQVARLRQCFQYMHQQEGVNIFPYVGGFGDWVEAVRRGR